MLQKALVRKLSLMVAIAAVFVAGRTSTAWLRLPFNPRGQTSAQEYQFVGDWVEVRKSSSMGPPKMRISFKNDHTFTAEVESEHRPSKWKADDQHLMLLTYKNQWKSANCRLDDGGNRLTLTGDFPKPDVYVRVNR